MARKRLINTDDLYFKSELVNILGARGLHLYIRLWGLAEDWGGYEPDYDDIALRMGALKFTGKEVEKYINALVEIKKVIPYQINGKMYHWIKNLLEHQGINNPTPPRISLPEWIKCKIKEYKSGKKYAEYEIIQEKLPKNIGNLPVDYQKPTSSPNTILYNTDTILYDTIIVQNPQALELSKLLKSLILKNNPSSKITKSQEQKWLIEADRLLRIDKRLFEETKAILEWCQKDSFWHMNILSMSKFRKQYDRLNLQRIKQSGLDERSFNGVGKKVVGCAGAKPDKYKNL